MIIAAAALRPSDAEVIGAREIISGRDDTLMVLFTVGHFEPVQIFFKLMKGIVPDLVAGTHTEEGFSRCLKSTAAKCVVIESRNGAINACP